MSGDLFKIIDDIPVSPTIHFYRIEPSDIGLRKTLTDIFYSLSQLCWLSHFDGSFLKDSYETRAKGTLNYILNNVLMGSSDKSTGEAGEYIVSELSRQAIVMQKHYSDIPLGELIKQKVAGNPGFDFFTKNLSDVILFAEAKYNSSQNAYGIAMRQINDFINEKKDIADLPDIEKFVGSEACAKVSRGEKGFVAAFAAKSIPTSELLKNIQNNNDFKALSKYQELICVAVNV